ncbi:MAG TPA: DUF362 domain-containing protein, partial [Terriglobia bacterium]|nr:DUF362 domain-containing protein [Terriglobia bacterium]
THPLPNYKSSPLGMPGLFPGHVVQVVDPSAISNNHVSQPIVRRMLERGMKELTGKSSVEDAWRLFIQPTDVVGIKINPSGAPACCSSPEIVREIIRAVEGIGVPLHNIVVYDRYSYEVQLGSYRAFLPVGVRLVGIENGAFDVSGYDMNVYCQADFFGEWETRSYLAQVVSQTVTKIINVPTLKDHSAAGVTGCLKNLGYGSFNNVARSHHEPITFTDPLIGVMCSVEPLRSKAVLHIMDGMREVWHGGPLTQVQSFIAQPGMLILGTDPVAVDTIELDIISKKRQAEGALSLWDRNPKNITFDPNEFYHDCHKNLFYRQPGHIAAAGELGLGISDLQKIAHPIIQMGT